MALELELKTLDDIPAAAHKLVSELKKSGQKMVAFNGEMGAGKTTFIKAICKQLRVIDTMSSPTYSIVNEYHTDSNLKIFHFDLYRLKSAQELFEFGFDEYISSGNYLFIEWPSFAEPFLDSYLRIIINTENNNRYLCAEIIT